METLSPVASQTVTLGRINLQKDHWAVFFFFKRRALLIVKHTVDSSSLACHTGLIRAHTNVLVYIVPLALLDCH